MLYWQRIVHNIDQEIHVGKFISDLQQEVLHPLTPVSCDSMYMIGDFTTWLGSYMCQWSNDDEAKIILVNN